MQYLFSYALLWRPVCTSQVRRFGMSCRLSYPGGLQMHSLASSCQHPPSQLAHCVCAGTCARNSCSPLSSCQRPCHRTHEHCVHVAVGWLMIKVPGEAVSAYIHLLRLSHVTVLGFTVFVFIAATAIVISFAAVGATSFSSTSHRYARAI